MKISKELMKQITTLMIIAAILVAAVIYSGDIIKAIGLLIKIITPFIVGGVIAFILNIPMSAIERKWFGKWTGKSADRFKRPASLILTLLIVFGLVAMLLVLVIPNLTETFQKIAAEMPDFLDHASKFISGLELPTIGRLNLEGTLLESISQNWSMIEEKFVEFLRNDGSSMVNSTFKIVSSVVGTIVSGIIAFVFSLYILAQKEKLADHFTRLFSAYLPKKGYDRLMYLLSLLNKNFSSFITGQCLDASILGILFIIMMSILGIPYALMIGVLIAFTALIPIVGAFLGCSVGVLLILMDTPSKVVWFLILFICLQQIEGKLIYPRIVGGSVGLPAIWTLFAVFAGGSMFGAVGMLVFIPLVSTIYSLLRDDVNKRNLAKLTVPRS